MRPTPPTFLKSAVILQQLKKKITGSVPATIENGLAKLASNFSELSANSKAIGKM